MGFCSGTFKRSYRMKAHQDLSAGESRVQFPPYSQVSLEAPAPPQGLTVPCFQRSLSSIPMTWTCTLGSFKRDNSLWLFIESFPRKLWRRGPSLDTAIAKSKPYEMENKGICPHFFILLHADHNSTGAREPGTWWANTFFRTDEAWDCAP